MTQHTQEPWAFEGRGDVTVIVDENERILAEVPFRNPDNLDAPDTEDHANARRIVACVNALAGIPTEELEAVATRAERYPRMVMLAAAVERHTLPE